jgi:hypothetical protein
VRATAPAKIATRGKTEDGHPNEGKTLPPKQEDRHARSRAVALFLFYNFCRIHKTLRVTPAMAAGISDTVRDMEWIVGLIDAREGLPKKRGPYKKVSGWNITPPQKISVAGCSAPNESAKAA